MCTPINVEAILSCILIVGHLRTYEHNDKICKSCCEIIAIVSYQPRVQEIMSTTDILSILYHIGEHIIFMHNYIYIYICIYTP